MPTLIEQPTVIKSAGNKPKQIQEFAGHVNSGHSAVSAASSATGRSDVPAHTTSTVPTPLATSSRRATIARAPS